MTKFKVGDRIEVVGTKHIESHDGYYYKEGMIGIVTCDHDFDKVEVKFDMSQDMPEGAFNSGGEVWVGVEDLTLRAPKKQFWWETPEGVEWLSTQQDVEEQFLKSQEKKEESTYRVGQRFLVAPPSGAAKWYCLLAQVRSHMVCFIDLESGNRINEPVSVRDVRKITGDEMKMIAEDCTFQLL